MTGRRFYTVFFAGLLLAGGSLAQDSGRKAIAYSQAPEMSSGVCVGKDMASAIACAKQTCIDGGGEAEYCLDVAACFPARWSVDVFMQVADGPHWHEFYCGWESKELALKAAEIACDKAVRPDLIECAPVQIHDEEGKVYEAPFN